MEREQTIYKMTADLQQRIRRNPLLNIDAFIIPSPFIKDPEIVEDFEHSYVWLEDGELLGYILVYSDRQKGIYHIYKLVTSPFGRGRGIGRAFIEHLAEEIPDNSQIYLYLWEKQPDTLEFFRKKGFKVGEQIVYRNRIYYLMSATPRRILRSKESKDAWPAGIRSEDIGKARHDARKTVRLISHMVESLSVENSGKIIEDINRETTTLVNILNIFRDTVNMIHEVNLKDLIIERIIPYIEASSVPCSVGLQLDDASPVVLGYYVNYGRALINITSNSLEAIEESGRKGHIDFSLEDSGEQLVLKIRDNGTGISEEMMELNAEGIPSFVGKSTKQRKHSEGLGTRQIFSVFGKEHIQVESSPGEGTQWTISLDKVPEGLDKWFLQLERRVHETKELVEPNLITSATRRTEVISYVWQLRKMEILLFDLILQFSQDHNIRIIYRTILSYLLGDMEEKNLKKEISSYRCRQRNIQTWLFEICTQLKSRWESLSQTVDLNEYQGALFRSYAQADQVIIFTMDPESGDFLATDRKLAEHLDFVPYLEKERDKLVRGELIGDINREGQPITLGVWSVSSNHDLGEKLKQIKAAAKSLMDRGVRPEKRLAFYQSTYAKHTRDLDPDKVTSFGEFAQTPDEQLFHYTRPIDGFMKDYLHIID